MKKIIRYLCLFIVSFVLLIDLVFAAGFNISVTSNSVTVGNSITLKINVSDAAGKFTVSSSDSSVVSVGTSSDWIDNTTKSITLKANKVGSAVITVNADDVTDYNGATVSGSKKITITVKAKPVVNNNGGSTSKPKSSNSYLTSLSIDGVSLDQEFDKETLEYTATIPAETEKIKINAQLADSASKVVGTGEVEVSSGLNTFEIVVTAENGSKRTYVLKATVLELEPIEVKIDGDKYTVVRKRKDLPEISEYFEEKEILIGEEKVEGYYNETLKYDLVGLKDSKGNIEYYIYKNGKYTLYKEYTFNGTTLQVLDKEIEDGYKKTSFMYDGDKISSYQEVRLDLVKNTYALDDNEISGNQFYLFYAKNVETGKEYLYQYDALEKTIQRYNTLVLDVYKDQSNTYYMLILGGILVVGILIVIFSIALLSMGKKKKKQKVHLVREENILVEEEHEEKENVLEEDLPIKEDVVEEKNNTKKKKKKK